MSKASADPVYNTDNTFYLNSQLGEELITNPQSTFPEELLIKRYPDGNNDYSVIQYSSLLHVDSLLMSDRQLDLLRQYLAVIHDQFAVLYHAGNNTTFAMDIEYKIDSTNRLVIKQARPWVSYDQSLNPIVSSDCNFVLFPNPAAELIHAGCEDCGINTIQIADTQGKIVFEKTVDQTANFYIQVSIGHLPNGIYVVSGSADNSVCRSVKFIKQ